MLVIGAQEPKHQHVAGLFCTNNVALATREILIKILRGFLMQMAGSPSLFNSTNIIFWLCVDICKVTLKNMR